MITHKERNAKSINIILDAYQVGTSNIIANKIAFGPMFQTEDVNQLIILAIEKVAEERALNAIAQRQKAAEVENKVSQIQRAEEVFAQEHQDYPDVLQDVIDSGILDATVYQAIIDLPNSPEIVYKIGSDPDLYS